MSPTFPFVCNVLLARHSPSYGIDPRRWHWRRPSAAPHARYRPELHHMRGPGPKWREARPARPDAASGQFL
jgi:hypothetical protein